MKNVCLRQGKCFSLFKAESERQAKIHDIGRKDGSDRTQSGGRNGEEKKAKNRALRHPSKGNESWILP